MPVAILSSKRPKSARPFNIYLDPRLECEKGVASIAHFEDPPEAIFSQISNLEYFKIWWDGAKVELIDQDVINDDGRFRGFVQGRR